LAARLKDGLATIDGVKLVTPRGAEVSSGLVCFDIDGVDSNQVVARLRAKGIRSSVTPYAVLHVRLGTSLHVDERDVDAAVRGVASLA
jgi:selenocysteine lyase/cysteine desulfurase